MMARTIARSISRTARERLQEGRRDVRALSCTGQYRVLAVFERACDLVTHDARCEYHREYSWRGSRQAGVVALVLPEIGDGPLNVVVDGATGLFAGIGPGASATVDGAKLWVGGLGIDLGKATVWEPRPDWEALRGRRPAIASRLPLLRALCLRRAPVGSLLPLLEDFPPPAEAVLSTAWEAAEALWEGWTGDVERLREGAARLAGLGSGLTPAGDDFLTGVMLWGWLAHPAPSSLCQTLAEIAIPRTTTLSAALLQSAAQGECSAPWHALLAALSGKQGGGGACPEPVEGDAKVVAAVRGILAHGATSGADSLAGFLITERLVVRHEV